MKIRETLFKKSFSIENSDPYGMSLDFMRRMSQGHMIYEERNAFETDGPIKKSTVIFDVIETLDDFSHISIKFSLEGENNILYADVTGDFVVQIKGEGFFVNVFREFYLNNIFPQMRRVSEQRLEEFDAHLGSL